MTLNKLRLRANEKGFTLIELMIVIAIIGILAAIAIPNFISYRNKSYCSATESDANAIAAAVSDYFAIPSNTSISDTTLQKTVNAKMSNGNTWTVDAANIDAISITVTDASTRCPKAYQDGMLKANDTRGYWNGVDKGGKYVKVMATK